ncbi:hypothetical protein, partial [Sinorhizobium medicae]|uniref:hypothetical protein n=2 Tax=Sinorhizobium medicae TaxID=110321 RepID=UPI0027DDBCF5
MTACQDEIRDADRLIPLSRSSRIVEDDLISIEISPIGIIAHLVGAEKPLNALELGIPICFEVLE